MRRGQSARPNLTHAESRIKPNDFLFVDIVDSVFDWTYRRLKYCIYIQIYVEYGGAYARELPAISFSPKKCPQTAQTRMGTSFPVGHRKVGTHNVSRVIVYRRAA